MISYFFGQTNPTGTGPNIEEVKYFFRQNGGTEEQAQKFWNKWESVNWLIGMSKIMNWRPLANNFMSNYEQIQKQNGQGRLSSKQTTAANINSIGEAFADLQRDMDATSSEG